MTVGDFVSMDGGQKNATPSAVGWRTDQDSDTTSTDLASYKGNGARLVVVPINSGPANNYKLVGFAGFLLKDSSFYNGLHGNDSSCAIYVGAWTQGMNPLPGSGSGAWVLRLFQ